MANEVRTLVEDIIEAYPNGAEIPIDEIEEALKASGKDIDRTDIYNALKDVENTTDKGVLVLGRRQKPTRFCKGFVRVNPKLDDSSMAALRDTVKALQKNKEMPLDKAESIFGDRAKAIEALRVLENEGLGVFLIGRRGGTSRFIVGVCRDELTGKSKAVVMPSRKFPEPKTGPFADPPSVIDNSGNGANTQQLKYQRVDSVIFKTPIGGCETLKEVLEMYGYKGDKLDYIKQSLELYGHFNMASLSEEKSSNAEESSSGNEEMEEDNDEHDNILS